MTTIIRTPIKKTKDQIEKELKQFALPNRNPDKATEGLFGIWKGRNISIEKIRKKTIVINGYSRCRCDD